MILEKVVEKKYPARPHNPGYTPYPEAYWEGSAVDVFRRCVAERPESSPLVDHERSITYRQLNDLSAKLALAILSRMGADDRPIVLLFDKQVEIGIAMLAAAKAGRAYAPLEPSFPLDHLRLILDDLEPALIIPGPSNEALARSLGLPVLTLAEAFAHNTNTAPIELPHLKSSDPLLVIYTSGSTGRPKGVISQHASAILRARQRSREHQISPDERVLFIESANFGRGQGSIWSALLNGYSIFLYDITRVGTSSFAGWCNQQQINHWAATPSTFRSLVGKLGPNDRLETIRIIQLGGEMSRPADFHLFKQHFTDSCNLVIGYGLSEAGGISAVFLRRSDEIPANIMPVGYPYGDRQIFIVDENGNHLPCGEIGEVHAELQGNFNDYLNNEQSSLARYYVDPARPDTTVCRTGDLGWLGEDGCLYLTGRIDNQIKVRGMKVNTNDVAGALAHHPDVANVLVQGEVDARGNTRLVAYLETRSGSADPRVFRAFLEPDLPTHMIPAYFVFLEAIPRSSTGKVDSKKLPDIAGLRPALSTPFVEPVTDLEIALAKIWAEILAIHPIGLNDPFVDLGGDSLSATQVFAEVEKHLGASIPPGVLYSAPTIASLAKKMDGGEVEVKEDTFLLPIRQGSITNPVACFLTPMRGDVMAYSAIINAMDPDYTLYGLNSWLLKFQQLRKTTLPELAAQFIAELKTVSEDGPFVIGGHSFAGRLAYEMSRQLKEAGDVVPFIFMFDSSGPGRTSNSLFIYRPLHFITKMQRLETWRERFEFLWNKVSEWKRYWMRIANMVQVRTGIELPRPAGLPIGTDSMREPYYPVPQNVDILYFRADYDMGKYEDDVARGWTLFSTGRTTTHIIHDNHYEMLKGESGASVGRLLTEAIRALKIN
ncbi:MAG: hypothetical protein EPO32_04185 [Anaerolineae bacterium]|nr:MAG: hypothetical protein EPO32_04185 [Anaerolineae bacterium]